MPERSELPIYGNVIYRTMDSLEKLIVKKYNLKGDIYFLRCALNSFVDTISPHIRIRRLRYDNTFNVFYDQGNFTKIQMFPFRTSKINNYLRIFERKRWI